MESINTFDDLFFIEGATPEWEKYKFSTPIP